MWGMKDDNESLPTPRLDIEAARILEEEAQEQTLEEKQRGLPERLQNKIYKWERDFVNDLEEFGPNLEELRRDGRSVIRDDDGYAVWTDLSTWEHRNVVSMIQRFFTAWTFRYVLLDVRALESTIYVTASEQGYMMRVAHMALYGPSRLDGDGSIRTHNFENMNPHVVFQLCWDQSIKNAKAAVNEMMNYAGIEEYSALGRPYVAYLIKICRTANVEYAPIYGFDVYEVHQGQTTPDDPTLEYRVGGNEYGAITVAPRELDLEECNPTFGFTLGQIRQTLERWGTAFVNPP
eukprot:scaffold949_cov90-Cylindrotheca_fusiformis.AAC.5